MKNFDYVRKIKKEIERALILDERVVSIGTVREKDEQDQDTENYSIQVGLISRADASTIKFIRKKIAALLEMTDEVGAQSVESNDIKITFIEEGKINALRLDSIETPSTAMSAGGDSGSVVFERGTKKPVDLLFAASKTTTYSNHMPSVSAALAKAGFFGMSFSSKKRDFSTSCVISKNVVQKTIAQDTLSIAMRTIPQLLRR